MSGLEIASETSFGALRSRPTLNHHQITLIRGIHLGENRKSVIELVLESTRVVKP